MRSSMQSGLLGLLLFALAGVSFGQGGAVAGKVANGRDGSPLANASVMVKGAASGVTTAPDGGFTLSAGPDAVLVVSSVGFKTREVAVAALRANATILLEETQANLNEVVVVGYGTQRKRDLTGAVATVSRRDFVKGALQTPEQLIAGKVAGVQISSNGGAPGAGSRIRIRGGASLNASNDPLIVIDGVPVDNSGVAGSSNPLNLINPNDIESFTVLKDPSAAAIYGSRASNGVIIITTRKGSAGAIRYSFGSQFFLQQASSRVDVLSAQQIRDIVGSKGGGTVDNAKLGGASTDWQDEIYTNAMGQDLNLGISGAVAKGKLPFRLSTGYLNQDGILSTGNFGRQTVSLNLSPRMFKDRLRVDMNIKGARTTNRFANEGAIGTALSFDPTQPVRVNSPRFGGFFTYIDESASGKPPRALSPTNPVSLLEMADDNSTVLRSIGNLQLDYRTPVKGLRANLNLGYDLQQGKGTVLVSDSAPSAYRRWEVQGNPFKVVNYGGVNNQYESNRRNLLMDFYLNYVRDMKFLKSRVDLMAGTGYQDFLFTNPNYPDYRFNKTVIPGSEPQFERNEAQYTLISYYGRLNYSIADRYIITANLRTDGSSRFNKDNRWGVFPSVALAWRIANEGFLKDSKVVSDLKLRAGWGVTGQQDGISFYGYLPRYSLSNNAAQYQLGNEFLAMQRPSAYDPNLAWETTRNINLALDFGFFDNRISGSVDLFERKTEDLLSVVPIPLGTNFSNQLLTNVGNIESRGAEVTLNLVPVRNDRTTWEIGANFTYIDPKITNLLLNPDPAFKGNPVGGISGGTGNTIQIHSVGQRPNTFYVRKQIYQLGGEPIEGLYEDLNRDGIINNNDLYHFKSPDPRMFMGFNSSLTVGRWNAGFVARASIGNYLYNNLASNLGVLRQVLNPLGWLGNAHASYLRTGFTNNQYFSDYYVENASFFRMDNINIGYDAGEVMKNVRMRLTANVQNAFVVTKYSGLDPEVNGGIDNNVYPRPRIITFGLNLDF